MQPNHYYLFLKYLPNLPFRLALFIFGLTLLSACTPAVQVQAPSEPININLNVKIEHEIRIKIDKQLDDMFSESSGLF